MSRLVAPILELVFCLRIPPRLISPFFKKELNRAIGIKPSKALCQLSTHHAGGTW